MSLRAVGVLLRIWGECVGSKNNCLRLYYDWLDHIEPLTDAEFRSVILAAAAYSRDGEEPPPMDGAAGMAMRFMLSDMRRLEAKAESGRAGGLKRAEKAGARGMLQAPFKHASSMPQHIDIDKDIDNNRYYDNDRHIDNTGADAPCPSASVTEEEIITLFGQLCPSLIQPRGITKDLRDAMQQAARKYSRAELEELLRRAEGTPYIRGETGNGKKFSLSGVLKNAEKIIAGEYAPYDRPGEAGIREPWNAADLEYWDSVRRGRESEKGAET